ncbi:hypothetical protein VTN77DRAFT_1349 [Rasamsonia byssochlamydoides]|uniref:uncharacterized protein n=1 Tax=Rasamsonia byssochlamydoides TaxID=89139 RepID=UPI0037429017
MVFIRLTIKVLPREQLPTTSSSFSIRSILGDRNKEDADKNGNGAAGKPVSFLIPLRNPEEVTLGALAGMIQEKWKKLRPDAEPLEIKKLLDDEHDQDDLDADLTVADVFVNNGKARSDGLDQRATVRVVQKPTHAPVRYGSVVQDWDKAALDYERIKGKSQKTKPPVSKFSPIEEEPRKESLTDSFLSEPYSSNERRTSDDVSNAGIPLRDVPVRSVERDEPAVPPSPPRWGRESPVLVHDSQSSVRLASKELGDSPTPVPTTEPLPPVVEEGAVEDVEEEVLSEPVNEPVPEPVQKLPSPPSQPEQDEPEQEELEQEEDQPVRETGSKPSPKSVRLTDQTQDVEMTDVEPTSPPVSKNQRQPPQRSSPVVVIDNSQDLKDSFAQRFVAAANRKRKKSSEQLAPKKEPRLDLSSTPSTRPKDKLLVMPENSEPQPVTSSPPRKRERAPSFSSPQRRPSFDERPADLPKPGLGLGITKSPQKKSTMPNLSQDGDRPGERQPVHSTPLFTQSFLSDRRSSLSQPNDNTPSKAFSPGVEQVKKLTSALRKDSPGDRSEQRRSVSFAEETSIVTPTAAAAPRSTPKTGSKLSKATSTSSASAERTQSTVSVVWPPNVSQEKLQQYQSEAAQKENQHNQEKAEWERKIAAAEDDNADSEYLELLRSAFSCWSEMREAEKKPKKYPRSRLKGLARELEEKQKLIREKEDSSKVAPSDKPTKQRQSLKKNEDKKSPSSTKAGDQQTATKTRAQIAAPKTKSVEPADTTSKVPAETTEKDAAPQSSISDDNNLPPTDKVRSVQETNGKKDAPAPARTKTTATRSITKMNLTPESHGETDSDSPDEKGEEDVEEKTPEEPAADDSNNAEDREEEAEEAELSKAEMLQRHRSPSASVAHPASKPASVASATKIKPEQAGQDASDDEASGSSSESGDSESGESDESDESDEYEESDESVKSEEEEEEQSSEERTSSKPANGVDISSPIERKKSAAATKSSASNFSFNSGWTAVNGTQSPGMSSSQQKPRLSNGVSNRPDLKSLKAMMEETTQEAKKKAQEKAPERGSRPTRPRKSIFDPPSDSESSDSESESESESESDSEYTEDDEDSTDSSGDDSRGDILPTGKEQKMRKQPKRVPRVA